MASILFNEFQDEAARKRLLDIAKTRTTPPDTIAAIVRSVLGDEVRDISRIVRGESNEVYGIYTKQHNDIILRIGHWDKKAFERERWAIEQAVAVGVPVPHILATGEHSSSEKSVYYCIQEKLQGIPLDTLLWSEKISEDRAKVIVEKAGEVLGTLHGITTKGWGYLSEPHVGEFAGLSGRYSKLESGRERIAAAMLATKVPVPNIDMILEQLKSGLGVFEGRQCLIHGDFGPKHIFVGEHDTITGVIDWEQAASDDPVMEFARWNFWFEKSAPIAWLQTGHDRVTPLGSMYDERFRIAKLESAIWTLMYFTYDSVQKDCALRAVTAINEATR